MLRSRRNGGAGMEKFGRQPIPTETFSEITWGKNELAVFLIDYL